MFTWTGGCRRDGVLDFEDHNATDWKGWMNRDGDDQDWIRHKGHTDSGGTMYESPDVRIPDLRIPDVRIPGSTDPGCTDPR